MLLNDEINTIVKQHWGRLVALLVNLLQDIDFAEDVLQDALESALVHWQDNGLPQNPQAWLFTTAKHKALDKIRRAHNFESKKAHYQFLLELNDTVQESDYVIPDERLRLIFTCCHPALDEKIAIALTLRLLGGLSTEEIASAFLVNKKTMAQRLVRGKRKIKQAGIAYEVPEQSDFAERISTVLQVLYLIFNEGYYSNFTNDTMRVHLSDEAIRLTQVLLNLCPNEPEVQGLLALMLLNDCRRPARFNAKSEFIPLEIQNRRKWIATQKDKGLSLIQSALKQGKVGLYQLQAAISAIHCEAKVYQSTDWKEIVLLYNEMLKIKPTAVVKLNQLVALAQIEPVENIFTELNALEKHLINYQPFYLVKADLLDRLKEYKLAKRYLTKAIELCENTHMKAFLVKKLEKTPN